VVPRPGKGDAVELQIKSLEELLVERGRVSTEDLRKAMVHYRSLFDELLEDSYPERKEARG